MEAGFLKEAQEEFDKAVAKKDYHKNVNLGLARLRDIPDEEEKKEQELLAGVKRKADFYKVLGLAVSQPTPSNLSTRWQGPECELHVSMSGNKVRAIGSYEKEASSGLMALSSNSKTTAKYQIEYEGTLDGRVIDGTVQRTRQGDGSVYTALGIGDPKTKVLIAIDDGGVLRAIENPHGMTPGYYELRSI
jgi:hypothetical protein